MATKSCDSCLMPFNKDPGKREHDSYCSYCYQDGKLRYEGNSLKEFQQVCYQGMRDRGINPVLAWIYTFCIRFAPRWRDK